MARSTGRLGFVPPVCLDTSVEENTFGQGSAIRFSCDVARVACSGARRTRGGGLRGENAALHAKGDTFELVCLGEERHSNRVGLFASSPSFVELLSVQNTTSPPGSRVVPSPSPSQSFMCPPRHPLALLPLNPITASTDGALDPLTFRPARSLSLSLPQDKQKFITTSYYFWHFLTWTLLFNMCAAVVTSLISPTPKENQVTTPQTLHLTSLFFIFVSGRKGLTNAGGRSTENTCFS